MRGFALRSIVCLKVCAVTGWFEGGENRTPGRIVNVYVRPSLLTVGRLRAASGTRRRPPGPVSSGKLSSVAQVAYSITLAGPFNCSPGSRFVRNEGTPTTAVPPLGFAAVGGWTLAQTLPSATTSACGLPPTVTRAVGRFVRSSIRVNVPSPPFATQTLSPSAAIAVGSLPTGIVVITAPVAGSIDLTVPSIAFATQTARFPTAIADGPRPTGICLIAPEESTRRTRSASG